MKKILAITAFTLPMAIAPAIYAQTTGADTGSAAGATTTPGSTAPATTAPPPATTAPTMPPAGGATGDATAVPGQTTEAISGWSVKDKIIGSSLENENDEKIGEITDVVLSADGKAAYFIVGAGGFLGMGAHDVAIPFDEVTHTDDKLILQGYTKDQLKALPRVEVAD